MRQKGSVNILLVVLAIILAVALLYVALFKKEKTIDETQQPAPVETENKITIPKEYVKKTDDSANEATFVFAVPVKKQDIVGDNIKYCVFSASAGSDGVPECKETTPENSFLLQYNENTRTLRISDPSPGEWGEDSGPFRIGCAACFSAVEFEGIRTLDGQLLPKKTITVY